MTRRQLVILNVASLMFVAFAITTLLLVVNGHQAAAAVMGLPIAGLLAIMLLLVLQNGSRLRK